MALGLRPLGLWAAEPHLPLAAHGTLGLAGALLETRNGPRGLAQTKAQLKVSSRQQRVSFISLFFCEPAKGGGFSERHM